MDKNKKALLIWYFYFAAVAAYFFTVGYSYGKAKRYAKIFAFGVPESFSQDDLQYYLSEAMRLLKAKKYEVSNAELNQIANEACKNTIASRSLCNELFQTGDE